MKPFRVHDAAESDKLDLGEYPLRGEWAAAPAEPDRQALYGFRVTEAATRAAGDVLNVANQVEKFNAGQGGGLAEGKQSQSVSVKPGRLAAWQKHLGRLRTKSATITDFTLLDRSPILATVIGGKGRVILNKLRFEKITFDHANLPKNVWDLLPKFLSEPRFVYTRPDDTNTVILVGKTSLGSNVVVGIRKDDQILTVTPWEDMPDETSDQRVARELVSALSRPKSVYAISRETLDETLKADAGRPRRPAGLTSGISRQGHRVKVVFRSDIVKEDPSGFAEPPEDARPSTLVAPERMAAWRKHLDRLRAKTATTADFTLLDRSPILAAVLGGKGRVILNKERFAQINKDHPDIPAATWALLPDLVANPRFVFTRQDAAHNLALVGRTVRGSNIIVSVRGDDQIPAITPMDDRRDVGSALGASAPFRTIAAGQGLCCHERGA